MPCHLTAILPGSGGQHSPAEVDTPVLTVAGPWGMFFFIPYAAREEPLSEWDQGGRAAPYNLEAA